MTPHDYSMDMRNEDGPSLDELDEGHECQRNPRPVEDGPGTAGELWERTYECAYHDCPRGWTDWYAPVFDEENGWVNEHECSYDGLDRAPELDLYDNADVVEERVESVVIEGSCVFCGEDGVQVLYELDGADKY